MNRKRIIRDLLAAGLAVGEVARVLDAAEREARPGVPLDVAVQRVLLREAEAYARVCADLEHAAGLVRGVKPERQAA